jgi:sortase A
VAKHEGGAPKPKRGLGVATVAKHEGGAATQQRGLVVAKVLSAVGRTMITAGTLLLLFVAYQLWGTGIRTAQAQNRLDDELAEQLAAADEAREAAATSTSTTSSTSTTTTTVEDPTVTTTTRRQAPSTVDTLPEELLPQPGAAVGQIVIPAIGVDWTFVEGVSVANLKDGPGHYPTTPLPGQAGNAAIAGHRTTYGAPFGRVDELAPGDEIGITTVQGTFTYLVETTEIVSPSQTEVLNADHWDFDGDPATLDDTLTLTSCHPKYSARQRIIIGARLVGPPVPPFPRDAPIASNPGEDGEPDETGAVIAFEGDAGDLSGDRAGAWPAILWGGICALIWGAAWVVGRRRRSLKWPAYVVGFLPFMIALYFFFENFSRLLPANY